MTPANRPSLRPSLPARRVPRARARSAFTLIELLIVVVIIGILAAIAIPKFAATKGKANFAAMRSDLHNLTTAQEGYYYDNRTYSNDLTALQFSSSSGVIVTVPEATNTGWSATSTHPQSAPHFCALYIGTATAVPPATAPGIVTCQ
jgi:type IV pilus assembly protein PilA